MTTKWKALMIALVGGASLWGANAANAQDYRWRNDYGRAQEWRGREWREQRWREEMRREELRREALRREEWRRRHWNPYGGYYSQGYYGGPNFELNFRN